MLVQRHRPRRAKVFSPLFFKKRLLPSSRSRPMPFYVQLLHDALTTELTAILPIIGLLLVVGLLTAILQAALQIEDAGVQPAAESHHHDRPAAAGRHSAPCMASRRWRPCGSAMPASSCTAHGPERSAGPGLAGAFPLAVPAHHRPVHHRAILRLEFDPGDRQSSDRRRLCRRSGGLAAQPAAFSRRSDQRDLRRADPDCLRLGDRPRHAAHRQHRRQRRRAGEPVDRPRLRGHADARLRRTPRRFSTI